MIQKKPIVVLLSIIYKICGHNKIASQDTALFGQFPIPISKSYTYTVDRIFRYPPKPIIGILYTADFTYKTIFCNMVPVLGWATMIHANK